MKYLNFRFRVSSNLKHCLLKAISSRTKIKIQLTQRDNNNNEHQRIVDNDQRAFTESLTPFLRVATFKIKRTLLYDKQIVLDFTSTLTLSGRTILRKERVRRCTYFF